MRTTDSGRSPETTGPPAPTTKKLPDGQFADHWVLTEAERAKGFVRPVRDSYIHVGPPGPEGPLRDLTEEERERCRGYGYVKYEEYPEGSHALGRYWTQKDLDRANGSCSAVTTMSMNIAETYARKPDYYGQTFCCRCGDYFPVGEAGEFVWKADGDRVGT